MILNSDSYFSIGTTHRICQDYSLNGSRNDGYGEWASVSDGCSGSAFTDFGSRILVHSLKYSLYQQFNSSLLLKDALKDAPAINSYCNLPEQALDATLFHLFIESDSGLCNYKKYTISAFGDGAIIKIRNDNAIEFTYIEYPSGAPLYLNYYSNPKRFKAYTDEFGLQRKIYNYVFTDNIVTDFKVDTDCNGEGLTESGLCDDYKAILVTSDGISSFIGPNNTPIEITVLVRELCNFKSYKGEFIKRRMNGFKNYCEKEGWKHTDDFSMAGIHIDNA